MSTSFKRSMKIISAGLAVAALAGCGSGNEPIGALGDPTARIELAMPLAFANYSAPIIPFTAAAPSITLTYSVPSQPITAPAAGIVTAADIASGTVTIFHNTHLTTTLVGVGSLLFRVGDFVTAGQQIGTIATFLNLKVSTVQDGVAVCPQSFLNSADRIQLASKTTTGNPCQ